jgi:ADP-ribose pyrophosphatase
VAIVAIDDAGQVLLVRQHRRAVRQSVLELPAGIREKDEAGPAAAQRELGEEAGMQAALLERLTEFFTSPGFTDEVLEVYLATGLSATMQHADAGEKIDEMVRMPLEEAFRLCSSGEIRDSKTIIGIALARERQKVRASTGPT